MDDMRSMNEDVGRRVVVALVELQGSRTGNEMAAILGCSRPYYWQLRMGKRRISYEMAKRAAQVFPSILSILMHDLSAPVRAAS